METNTITSEKKKVSIIMPVYNAEEYLRETLDSVLAQTLTEFELLCVDDGSVDGSGSILEEYQKADSRLQIFHQKNLFAGVARNRGMEAATGEFLVFWDADDIFEPTALEEMYEKCVEDEADICLCEAYEFDEALSGRRIAEPHLKPNLLPAQVPFTHEDIDKYLFNFSTNVSWNKMFRHSLLTEHHLRYQEYRHGEDTMFAMLAFFYAKRFTIVEKPLVNYRVFNEGSLTGKMSERPMDVLHSYEDTWEILHKEENYAKVEQSFRNKFLAGMVNDLKHTQSPEECKASFANYREKLKEWQFPEEEAYYLSPAVYERLMIVLYKDYETYLLSEYKQRERQTQKFRGIILRQRRRVERMEERIERMLKRIERAEEERNDLREEKKEFTKQIRELNKKVRELEGKYEKSQKQIANIENSFSYKAGRGLTWLPRKIRGGK